MCRGMRTVPRHYDCQRLLRTGRNMRAFFEEPVKVEVFVSKLRSLAAMVIAVALCLRTSGKGCNVAWYCQQATTLV